MRRSSSSVSAGAIFIVIILIVILLGTFMFTNCYSEHREQGFTVFTSIQSCSG